MIKKAGLFIMFILISFVVVSAELEIKKEALIDTIVPEINKFAKYRLEITNLGASDSFIIYSLVGVDIKPNATFDIASGETKKLEVELWPDKAILENPGTFNFVYKIDGQITGMHNDVIPIRIVNLKDAFDINSYNINPESDKATVYIKNMISLSFPQVEARFYSAFFDFSRTFSLNAHEKKEIEVALDREKIKNLAAGSYIISSDIRAYNAEERIENTFRFTEKEEITSKESKSGIIISKLVIEKTNDGNMPSVAQVRIDKNIISRLFTTFNIEPVKVERKGLIVEYVFQKEIRPGEVFAVKVTTNWFYPLILLIAIIIIALLIRVYTFSFLVVKKSVTFVRTKGGEFALKINLIVRARKFVEKINVADKIPAIVKLHERFGAIEPDEIDEKNKRLKWNVDFLQPGEERVFSYIIYSKISPIGKFELPQATAVYEREGKIHETKSNKVFFLSEQRRKEE